MHKVALDAHIHANGACHEDDTQKQGVALHGAHSFSMEGGEKALEPCKGEALQNDTFLV